MHVDDVTILCRRVRNYPTALSVHDFGPRLSFEFYFRKKSLLFSLVWIMEGLQRKIKYVTTSGYSTRCSN